MKGSGVSAGGHKKIFLRFDKLVFKFMSLE